MATNNDKGFALRIALFNSVGFIFATAGTTYVDARLTSHVVYSTRNYPLGYWICFLAPVIFFLTYLSLRKSMNNHWNIFLPVVILLTSGLIALPVFLPEFPHLGVTSPICWLALLSLAVTWIRHEPIGGAFLQDSQIPCELKVERLKESITLWRTLATGFAIGYMALVIPAFSFFLSNNKQIVTKPDENSLLMVEEEIGFILFTVYVFLGIIYEAVAKATLAADLLLTIKKTGNIDSTTEGMLKR